MFRRGAFALVLALAACHGAATTTTPAPSNSADPLEARIARLETRFAPRDGSVPPTVEGRLARLETRIDRVIAFLNQAVPPTLDENHMYAVPVDALDPVVGPADAKVTVIEAFEYLCPYCSTVAPTMEQLAAKYPKDVRVVSKYLVIHGAPAMPPGFAACAAAKQGKYAAMQKAIWSTIWPAGADGAQRDRALPAALEATARTVGLDLARYTKDVESSDCKLWLMHSASTLQTFGGSATPTFYINGRPFSTGRTLEEFAAAVDAEIATVNASGVPAARYYSDVVIKTGEPKAITISQFED